MDVYTSVPASICIRTSVASIIISSVPRCSTRPTLVALSTLIETDEDVLQVMPEHVTLDRCGGSCYVPAHSCNAVKTSVKKVHVMLVLAKWPHGEHDVVCQDLDVEVHEECECGCKLKHLDCHPTLQYYHQHSCR